MNPLTRFAELMAEATEAGVELSNAVTLCTVDADGLPWGRTVLVKGVDAESVTFFTNQQSAKADALRANPRASMTVYWHAILKQVQLAGPVEPLADDENDAYFATRPRGSQIGAWASAQSRPLESRQALLDAVAQQEQRFADVDPIPRPPPLGRLPHPRRRGRNLARRRIPHPPPRTLHQNPRRLEDATAPAVTRYRCAVSVD